MSKRELQARPIYHHKRESIEAHLNIVFAALAVSHWIEHQTGWSIKKFARNARRYRTVQIRAGQQTLTAADLIPDDLREAITKDQLTGQCALIWAKSGGANAQQRSAGEAVRVAGRVAALEPGLVDAVAAEVSKKPLQGFTGCSRHSLMSAIGSI
jgi:hypothetical protein